MNNQEPVEGLREKVLEVVITQGDLLDARKLTAKVLRACAEAGLCLPVEGELPFNPRNAQFQYDRWYDYMCGQESMRDVGCTFVVPLAELLKGVKNVR